MKNEITSPTAKEIFARAVELPPAARAVFVQEECARDDALRSRVEALLANHDDDSRFLEDPVLEVNLAEVAKWTHPDELLIGERINGWTIDRVIASGGMGTVYQASSQDDDDTVAIKLMRAGVASENAMRRFRFEAEILSRLQHDGIAKVYESGTHDDGTGGVPFFVMEYVADAQPMTEYAEARALSIRQRVELFAQVCDAVHHGHQKGIIHRDIKPANILVDSEHGRVKVIDFGVARATDSDLAVTTIATSAGDLLGTLQYMSPEQCGTDPSAVDVRSDIYSLGVVLYELICGEAPYDVREVGVLEAARRIREAKPQNPREIKPNVPADLATIVLKALEKEPERRYESAAAFAEDLRRFLNDEPITARPPSAIYQMRKFARRNKGIVTGAVVAILTLLSSVVVSTLFAIREADSREEMKLKSDGLLAVNAFFNGILVTAAPNESPGGELTVREALDRASSQITDRFGDHPLIEADIRVPVGNAYLHLGQYELGLHHYEKALEIRRRLLGESHEETLDALEGVANALRFVGNAAESIPVLRQIVEVRSGRYGDLDESTVAARNNLVLALGADGRASDAIPIARRALEDARRLPHDEGSLRGDQWRHVCLNSLAYVLLRAGRDAEAAIAFKELYDEIVPAEGEFWTADTVHDGACAVLANYSACLQRLERYDDALSVSRQAITVANRLFEPGHPHRLYVVNNHGVLLSSMGKYEEAEVFSREALDGRIAALGADHPDTLNAMMNLGVLLSSDMDRPDDAEGYLRTALETWEARVGVEGPQTLHPREELAINCHQRRALAEAESLHRLNIEVSRQANGDDDEGTIRHLTRLANVLIDQGMALLDFEQFDEAEPVLRECYELRRAVLGPEDWLTANVASLLGASLAGQGRFLEAERLLLDGFESMNPPPELQYRKIEALQRLIDFYDEWDKPDDAATWRARLDQSAD